MGTCIDVEVAQCFGDSTEVEDFSCCSAIDCNYMNDELMNGVKPEVGPSILQKSGKGLGAAVWIENFEPGRAVTQ